MKPELAPLDVIRVETALSRHPIHRLAKSGTVRISISKADADGEMTLCWEVSCNEKYGQPGPLAYKLDTLVVNRRIEAAGRPIPRYIRLGSLNEICRELGLVESGANTNKIKRALLQNASAFITAKIRYKSAAGAARWIEVGDTRYAVVFTGETLPDGRTADAVYIVPHDFYREILDHALVRPLDYDYLKDLPPAAQRLYEVASYALFAALKNDRPRARLAYSEFCRLAPLTRYFEWEHARKQMAKIHTPHRKSGYLAGVEFEATTDREGRPDWTMVYEPGPKAKAEHLAFTRRGRPVVLEIEPPPAEVKPPEPEPTGLERELVDRGVTRSVAADLVRDFPEDRIRAQLEHMDWLRETKPKRVADVGAYLAEAIRKDFAAPAGFRSQAERAEAEATTRARQEREAEARQAKARAAGRRGSGPGVLGGAAAGASGRRSRPRRWNRAAAADRAAYEAATGPARRLLLVGLRDAVIRRRLDLPAADLRKAPGGPPRRRRGPGRRIPVPRPGRPTTGPPGVSGNEGPATCPPNQSWRHTCGLWCWMPSGRTFTKDDEVMTQHATIRLRGLKVATPIAADQVPLDLVPADGPAGNPTVTLELEGFGPVCTAQLNGKSYRRMLKALAERGPEGVTILLQGTLKPVPGGLPVLEGAGISAVPRSPAAPAEGGPT